MTTTIYTDRSRVETYQLCARRRFLEYHECGVGIRPMRKPLPLVVGGSVHVGLAVLLRESMGIPLDELAWTLLEAHAVQAALADFAQHAAALELDAGERLAMEGPAVAQPADLTQQLEASLGMPSPGGSAPVERSYSEMDAYLAQEQASLVEAMVRAYARRRLRPLLEEFAVLEVEREGTWPLHEWTDGKDSYLTAPDAIVFMSRPDALLRERSTNALHLLSYKTAAAWDVRKARDAERDMQGLSEGIEVERRLGEWWTQLKDLEKVRALPAGVPDTLRRLQGADITDAMIAYLRGLDAPPRILAVRMEYMLKGERWRDKDLSARLGFEARSQKTSLLRRYVATSTPQRRSSTTAAFNHGDSCVAWEYVREDGSVGKLAYQNWESRAVTDDMTIKQWIDLLDSATETMSPGDSTVGVEPRPLGWSCPAQALGFLARHPLDEVFVPPITVFRNDDDLRDLVDQVEAQEVRVAQGVAVVAGAADEGDRRHLLNVHFPQTRRACSYPTDCPMIPICYGGEDIRSHPLESGKFRQREPHHEPELVAIKGAS